MEQPEPVASCGNRFFFLPLSYTSAMHTARVLRTMALLLTVMFSAASLPADSWYQHYDQAERALEDKRWRDAVEQLNEALQRRGDSGAEVRTYGMKFIPYFPYLKLGIAYFNLGRFGAALRAFETEEQLSAVHDSPIHQAELQHYRTRVLEEQTSTAEKEAARIAGIVRSSLDEAETLQQSGRYDEALIAVARAIAVDPGNEEALSFMDRVRHQATQAELESESAARAARQLAEARELHEAGKPERASSLLRQSLALVDNPEAQTLLEEIQRAMTSRAQQPGAATSVETILDSARQLRDAGDIDGAIDSLQPILAAQPSSSSALELHRQLLSARESRRQAARVVTSIAESTQALENHEYEAALAAANRVLRYDTANSQALDLIRRAYEGISRQLLGAGPHENIPPAIRFADLRWDLDGESVQRVSSPEFRLTGIVIDDAPITVSTEGHAGHEISTSSQPAGEYLITTFVMTTRLSPGLHVLRITATDDAGLSSSSEYRVLYGRPLSRSPWVLSAVLAVPAVVLVVLFAVSRRRRQRLAKRRFNPFVAGAPVLDNKLFFGRNRLIERILQTIHNNSLLLHGERRIGKTSLQHHVKRRLEELDDPDFVFFPIYVDLQGTPEERFFATLGEDVFQGLGPHLSGLEPKSEPASDPAYGYRQLVHDLRRIFAHLQQQNSRKVKLVLLIDEVDELNDYDPRINQKLRSLFMKSFAENLVAIVSGVAIRKQWEREASPWFNFFEEIEVTCLARPDAEALITKPLRGIFSIEPEAVERIVDITGCRPYLIQKLCVNLVVRMYENGRRRITRADVEEAGRHDGQ